MTTQKVYSNKSNAARAARATNGGTLDGLTLQVTDKGLYYAALSDVGDSRTAIPVHVVATPVDAALRGLIDATNQMVMAGLQADAKAPMSTTKAAKKAAAKAAKRPVVKASKAPVAAPALPTGKDIASAYPHGVKAIPAHARKGTRTVTGYTLTKDRVEAHGVKRMSPGTVGDQLWVMYDDALAGLRKSLGNAKDIGAKDLQLGMVRKACINAGFNNTTIALAFYQWRRFHGVRGRGRKQKVD